MSQHVHLNPILTRLVSLMLAVSLLLAIVALVFPLNAQAAPVQPLLWCESNYCYWVGLPECIFRCCDSYCCNPSVSDCDLGYGWYCRSGWYCCDHCPY